MKIDRENIDEYYQIVNTKIDKFFKNNVSAKQLKRYLKKGSKGLERFLKREDLDDIKNIEKVISDVIEDRLAMEETGRTILTFENYIHESYNYNIEFDLDESFKSKIADLYKVSLGHIEGDKNHFNITKIKNDTNIYVYTKDMIHNIFLQIIEEIYKDFSMKNYNFYELDIDIPLHIIDKDIFKDNILEKNILSYQDVEKAIKYTTNEAYELVHAEELIIFEKK